MTPEELEAYEKRLEEDADRIDDAFRGKYKKELSGLYALSQEDVDALVPGTADLATYAKLISIVEHASAENLAQAELVRQIRDLGQLGVRIAKLVPALAALV